MREIQFRFQGLLFEAILGPVRPSVPVSLQKELLTFIIEEVLIATTSSGDSSSQEFHTVPFMRLLASFLNKADDGKPKLIPERVVVFT